MRVSLVAAVDENDLLGVDGRLPWRLPAEMAHFRAATMGRPVLMGRRTHEAIGRPLPGRTNIVLSRQPDLALPGCVVAGSLREALAAAAATGAAECAVIGGAGVFEEAVWQADRLVLTRVHHRFDVAGAADAAYFPRGDWWAKRGAQVVRERRHEPDRDNAWAWTVTEVAFAGPRGLSPSRRFCPTGH